jgi:glycerophosphoryl diester phosphodiesterase
MALLPSLIAHRGESADYPENSLTGISAALDAGADGVEFDIQFTGDGHPVVLHDRDLRRTGGVSRFIDDYNADHVRQGHLPAHEPDRFGERFLGECVPSLGTVVSSIKAHPNTGARIFVELKTETATAIGANTAVRRVLQACEDLGDRLTVIGFDAGMLRTARSMGAATVGWVVSLSSTLDREQAQVMVPDYLIADRGGVKTAGAGLWQGPWRWLIYEVNTVAEAQHLASGGAWGVETHSVRRLREAQ